MKVLVDICCVIALAICLISCFSIENLGNKNSEKFPHKVLHLFNALEVLSKVVHNEGIYALMPYQGTVNYFFTT